MGFTPSTRVRGEEKRGRDSCNAVYHLAGHSFTDISQLFGHIGQLPDWLYGTSVLRRGEGRTFASFLTPPFLQVVWLGSVCSPKPPTPEEARFQALVDTSSEFRSLRMSQCLCGSGQRWVEPGSWNHPSSCRAVS